MKAPVSPRPNPMTKLFSRYVSGEIRDTHWSRFIEVLDSDALDADDRHAFAAFFADALDEDGDGDVFLPIVSEAGDFFDDSYRAAA